MTTSKYVDNNHLDVKIVNTIINFYMLSIYYIKPYHKHLHDVKQDLIQYSVLHNSIAANKLKWNIWKLCKISLSHNKLEQSR